MLKTDKISIGYEGRAILKDISFSIDSGECVLLCGANGSGKSTFLKTLAGVLRPIGGKLECTGSIVLIPTGIPKVKGFTLKEFIRTGCYRDTDLWGHAGKAEERAMNEAMELLGISHLSGKDISRISDGEFQKGCIASALTRNASLMLFDEPTAFLDVDSRVTVLQALRKIAEEKNISVIFSSHDIHESSALCTRILGISNNGRLVDSATSGKDKVLSECFVSLRHSLRKEV